MEEEIKKEYTIYLLHGLFNEEFPVAIMTFDEYKQSYLEVTQTACYYDK